MNWTPEQVLTFAPDAATGQKGKDLASHHKWQQLAGNERALWGECKGSRDNYYKTQIDLQGPAFQCNCPSRKFPCKHAIALFLLYTNDAEAFRITHDYPEQVQEWLEKRGEKQPPAPPVEEALSPEEQKKLANRERTRNQRLALMRRGLEDLEIWLQDRIRQGLATTEGQAYNFWNSIATRMVDSKLGGLANRLKRMPLLQGANTEWPERMLAEFAQLYLVVRGFKQLEKLPIALQNDLLSIAGVNTNKENLLGLSGLNDDWLVMGGIEGVEENLNFRRTWLYGSKSGRQALLLDYSFGDAGYSTSYFPGRAFGGELVYYPSAYPLRALVKEKKSEIALLEFPQGYATLDHFFDAYTKALALNPWLIDFPCMLENAIPVMREDRLYLVDTQGKYIEALNKDKSVWKIMSLSGGQALTLFGEWTGDRLMLLSIKQGQKLIVL